MANRGGEGHLLFFPNILNNQSLSLSLSILNPDR
ncbi:hypothetical protein [Enterobacter phage vB_ExiM_F5M1E]|nr:hypothetical protein [Enterobacter phage vB_ExiM_F1M1E]UNA03116.1 hypothetical protein [Enterobacter phage vB_ExiM_F2M1E]UNA03437.1 hypothetical protein [Enterobacter phage vB_ExiM_F4M1E]UNA03758.1 hypothetical protein [Enterobacter phage vB_ExiM_F5M1E]UNA04078.1 hypothetical protein [Pantoea phage vB_PdiM_F5M2A]